MNASPLTGYNYGAFFKYSASSPGTPRFCGVFLVQYPSADCTGEGLQHCCARDEIGTVNWVGGTDYWLTFDNTNSIKVAVFCRTWDPTDDYTVLIDDVYLGTGQVPVELLSLSID